MKGVKSILTGVQNSLSTLKLPSLPSLGREVEIPVYMVHNSPDAEDYFFIFDFEEFVEASRSGVFVRPKLKVWSGRDDFDRRTFAQQFRQSFAQEFDAARAALAGKSEGGGWFSWFSGLGQDVIGGPLAAFVANVVLLIALSAGRLVLSQLLPKSLFGARSDASKLEESIESTKGKVDEALTRLDVVLHRELYTHAYKGASPGRLSGMDYEAWPLPAYVSQHLEDKASGSWW